MCVTREMYSRLKFILLAFSTNTGSSFLGACSLRFRDSLIGFRWSSGCFLLGLGSLDGLVSLCLAHFRFLVPLSQNFSQRGSNDGALEFLGLPRLLLSLLLFLSLLVLASVEDSPSSVTWVPLHKVGAFTFRVEEMVNLSVNTDHGFAMAGVDFV